MAKTVYDCCSWVLVTAKPDRAPVICRKPTRWKMVRDDDGNLVRKYEPFCDEHKTAAEAMENEW